jgi:hypothetical protein
VCVLATWVLVLGLGGPPSKATPAEPQPPPRAPRFDEPVRLRPRPPPPSRHVPPRYTGRQRLIRPALRISPGFVGRWTNKPYAAFGLDVLASVLVGLHPGDRQLGLAPELGYSMRAPGLNHDLLVGLGLVHGINADYATWGLLPRAVLRGSDDGLAAGVRAGLWYDFAENGFSVELAYQWTRALDPSTAPVLDQHELRLSVAIDVLMLAIVLNKNWSVGFI